MRRCLAAILLDRRIRHVAVGENLNPDGAVLLRRLHPDRIPQGAAPRVQNAAAQVDADHLRKKRLRQRVDFFRQRGAEPIRHRAEPFGKLRLPFQRELQHGQFAITRAKPRSAMTTNSGMAEIRKAVVSWPPRLLDVMAILSR